MILDKISSKPSIILRVKRIAFKKEGKKCHFRSKGIAHKNNRELSLKLLIRVNELSCLVNKKEQSFL
jgi:hypothetical protein